MGIQVLQLIVSLSILVVLHEGGHFLFARLFKTRVEKFYLFFNPWFSIFKFKKGDTEYGIGWLPLGGYVKIAGMIDESMDREQMKKPPKPDEFRAKPPWQRLFIMTGGVLVNFIAAFLIYSFILSNWGREYIPTENLKYGVVWDSVALEQGFRDGDKIININGEEVEEFNDITKKIINENPAYITVKRNNKMMQVELPDNFIRRILAKEVKMLVSPAVPFVIDSVMPGKPATLSGLQKNDRILAVNNNPAPYYLNVIHMIRQNKGDSILITVERSADTVNVPLKVTGEGIIGIYRKPLTDFIQTAKVSYTAIESIPAGFSYGVTILGDYVRQLKYVFTKEGAKSLGGFGTIGSLFPKTWDWLIFLKMTALLSIILAFVNILPIPALDGGHVLFLLYEMITGKKPGDKFIEYAQIIGMLILLSLVFIANGNDIIRWLNK